MRVSGLYIYPIKGMGAVSLEKADVTTRGLMAHGIGDRQWMLIDENNKFITQREEASLAVLRCNLGDGTVEVGHDGHFITLNPNDASAPAGTVAIWKDQADARLMPDECHAFFSRHLNRPVRLVHLADGVRMRDGQPKVGQSFADGHPILTVNTASLTDLNNKLETPVGMDRFRPNIVVETDTPWAEDTWKAVLAGEVGLEMAKPCPRCIVTTIDQQTGEKTGKDPLATLVKFRFSREYQGALFGQDTIATRPGTLRVGDTWRVLTQQEAPPIQVRSA